jgi:hypothetical protein
MVRGLYRAAGTVAMGIAAAALAAAVGIASQQLPPPVSLTHEQERQRMLDLLGIGALPPGAQGSSPDTYDESRANPYPTLPDPLTMKDGRKVTSAAMWPARRAELLEDFAREVYGRRPSAIPQVAWQVVGTSRGRDGDVATVTKHLVGRVDNAAYPHVSVNIVALLTTPADLLQAVPVVLQFGGFGMVLPEGVPTPSNPCVPPGTPPRSAPPPPASAGPTWQQQVLAKNWGYVVMHTTSVQADCAAWLTAGIIGLVNQGQPRAVDDWGALSAWAWGASRVLDYLESDTSVDATKVAVQGHSRYGKAALVALAFDERFATGYISSSGHGGAKLHRRRYGERIENVASTYYYWMAGTYMKYAGRWDVLPVDSHELIALVAPRPVFVSAGRGPDPVKPDGTVQGNDAWVDPKGSFLAAVGAAPVYELLGKKGLGTTDFPPIDTALIQGDIGFRQHTEGHVPGPTWPTFLAFAERYLGCGCSI